ncbi:MAG: flavin reductase family protein [Clostridia bacterium]|nr:flavin reductase family protein [Clostridia bacterium]
MNQFKSVDVSTFEGVFGRIGKDWMLIGSTDGTRPNLMTASWGTLGVLWNKPVAICFIRPERHTYSLVEKSDRLSLAFFEGEEYRAALAYCGRASGKNEDKFAGAGLTPMLSEAGVPYPAEASAVLLCRKLYVDDLKAASFLDPALLSHYQSGGLHRVYVCEIEDVLVRA